MVTTDVTVYNAFCCQDALLGGDAPAFWAANAYTERVGSGTYGTDSLPWSPRKWSAGKKSAPTPLSTLAQRKALVLPALKRVSREHRWQTHSR